MLIFVQALKTAAFPWDMVRMIVLWEHAAIWEFDMRALVVTPFKQGVRQVIKKNLVVTPLLSKPGTDLKDFGNFQPKSNVSVFAKVLEKIVTTQLYTHLEKCSILGDCQSGSSL